MKTSGGAISGKKEVTLVDINALLNSSRSAQDFSETSKLYSLLQSFVLANEFVENAAQASQGVADDLSPILSILSYITDAKVSGVSDIRFRLLVLKTLRILSRKAENRVGLPSKSFKPLVQQLQHSNAKVSSEGASILLNLCYEQDNVDSVLQIGGVELLSNCLESEDEDLQANACGAIQSISYQKAGRGYVHDHSPKTIPLLVKHLLSTNAKVGSRAVGALHNLSTNLELVIGIRNANGIPSLVKILSQRNGDTARSAAGTIMNISRDTDSRKIVRDAGAIEPLTALLFGSDVPSQTSAMGALLNILGADIENEAARSDFKRLLSLALVLGIANDCLTPSSKDEKKK